MILNPRGESFGATFSNTSRRIAKNPDIGSSTLTPSSILASAVAVRLITTRQGFQRCRKPPPGA